MLLSYNFQIQDNFDIKNPCGKHGYQKYRNVGSRICPLDFNDREH